ncbi:hypothetical protein KXV22_003799 [Aspergillus fumigatus]|nr:hypothetical protein KXX69_000238 [Aspergillus fumigatus]KAH1859773.1 hypothetical protein KXX54_006911 [Aspergillus fumigatus]KAH2391910.1 hypothetical protein KXW92_009090 [Aspergillus fumigatus]KAH2524859.1 hypothetical protein KXW40_009447 [Aspergillus fumigatus]KAH2862479.1 hypothetical protein KXV67_009119 [Aspergillus fumigatus]
MNVISDLNKDVITEKSAKLIGLLLNIEADAADGRSYTTRSLKGDDDEGQDGTGKNNDELHLYIPYLGVVKIARQDPISCEVCKPRQITPVELSQTGPTLAVSNDAFMSLPQSSFTEEQQPLNHLLNTVQGSPFQGAPPASDWLNVQFHEQSTLQNSCPSQDDITLQSHARLPAITAV